MTTGQEPRLFGDTVPEGGGLFAGGSVLGTATGRAAAADAWAVGLSSLDEDALASALFEASLQRPGPPPERVETRRAATLLMACRFHDALSVLPRGLTLPRTDGPLDRDEVVLATCRAALGDDAALGWLTEVAPMLSATDWAGFVAHCLLRVGDARGDADLSRAALAQLGRLGDRGRHVVPRLAADLVGRRPGRPVREPYRPWASSRDNEATKAAEASAKVLRAVTDLLHTCSASFVSDPQPVLDTAAELERRGDRTGAALVLNAVDQTNPDVRRVRTALMAYGDPLHRRRRGIAFGVAAAVMVLSAPLGLPVLGLVALLAVLASEVTSRAPGLDRFESGVVTTYVSKLRHEPPVRLVGSVADEPVRGHRRADVMVVAGLASVIGGIVVFPHALQAARTAGPAAMVDQAGLLCVLVWILGLPALALWGAALVPIRRRYVIPTLSGPEADCQCAKGARADGPFASAYAAAHLVESGAPPDLAPALAASPLRPTVRTCPDTGAAWLVLLLGPEDGKILLRSPIGSFSDPPSSFPEPSTGQYL